MKIIISPAKKMKMDIDSLPYHNFPKFLPEAKQIMQVMQNMSDIELQSLWKCNDSIVKLNIERLRTMNLKQNLTPAILAYDGIQYQYMAPGIFEYGQFDYIEKHLRILSGFYGLLCPFDGVVPYRLEMQAKINVAGHSNLYEFWGDKLTRYLFSATDQVLNLASKEYSKVITAYLPDKIRFLTCIFGELKAGKIVEKGTLCKIVRGQMVRWLAENNITNLKDIRAFQEYGYFYDARYSTENHYVFLKGGN